MHLIHESFEVVLQLELSLGVVDGLILRLARQVAHVYTRCCIVRILG